MDIKDIHLNDLNSNVYMYLMSVFNMSPIITNPIINDETMKSIMNLNTEDHNYDIIQTDRIAQLDNIQKEALELFKKKNKDYGDSFATYGSVGVIVRLGDKINRLSSITKHSVHLVEDEKIRDTLIDLHNYAAMAIMLLDETNTSNE